MALTAFGVSAGFASMLMINTINATVQANVPDQLRGRVMALYVTVFAGSAPIGGLVALGLSVPLMAAYWFAPALVMIHGMGPVAAMKESFFACFRNFIPFVLYGIAMLYGATGSTRLAEIGPALASPVNARRAKARIGIPSFTKLFHTPCVTKAVAICEFL